MRWVHLTLGAALLVVPERARADDKADCIRAHADGQRLRNRRQFARARDELVSCARESCPAPLQRECADFLAQLELVQPTVVIAARDEAGRDISVSVSVDGAEVENPPGAALPIDPGEHVLRFVAPTGSVSEQRIVVREGEKGRRIDVAFAAIPPRSEPPRRDSKTAAYLFGGTALLALVPLTIFGLAALSKGHDLRSTCPTDCPSSDVDRMRRDAVIADISLGVSLVSLGTAIAFWMASGSRSRQ